ncbi:hypothetical protein TREAZ_2515 [Leadbettera azotonutricia ZAS-9]|uniref:Uncharacterized protein n=1 Tax=Leadbettera azotonutricia (strain ATCC BAA-888 / DSM 13862 / ZAS-9) TaxID=545695 RepID=F5YF50_LEAAZ|nr:hypothetical protein TREAZ_2515 [Leadbettera azotonutricia ZAS-9]
MESEIENDYLSDSGISDCSWHCIYDQAAPAEASRPDY